LAAIDVDLDGIAEIMAAPGGKSAGDVLFLDGDNGTALSEYSQAPFPNAPGTSIYLSGSVI
jgi:hypothetical protein